MRNIEFIAGYHEWTVIVDGVVIHAFDDFSEDIKDDMTEADVDCLVDDLIYGWQMSFENDCDSLDDGEECPVTPIWETNMLDLRFVMLTAICEHYGIKQKLYRVIRDLQGGTFGMDRDMTIEQWREQAMEWAFMDDNEELEKEVEELRTADVLPFIEEIWQIEFAEVVEE